ncbi:MAG: hypothetical protein A4E49_02358 [Methanosaeta sp. PtaU1.Bin112]|nr:MAG: hypothetical protein A4E49_02358 [Methanosaeta sp. PtaU1.Bin112]
MSGCEHKMSGSREKVWLPYYFEGRERGLKPHPYCVECGLIKNLSSEKPRSIGYFMNIIADLGNHYKVAKVQTRLIALEMEKQAMDDKFGMDRMQQEDLFVEIVTRILNIPARVVSEYMD